jgi:hypothetical protein
MISSLDLTSLDLRRPPRSRRTMNRHRHLFAR